MHSLTVLYDTDCRFCIRCADWLRNEPQFIPLDLIPLGSEQARAIPLPDSGVKPGELVAIDDEGGIYAGDQAYIICLYALRDYRAWSARLMNPAVWPLARRAMEWVTGNRTNLSRFFKEMNADG